MRSWLAVPVGVLALAAGPAGAGVEVPGPHTSEVYVTGRGFDSNEGRSAPGIPGVATLAFDEDGFLYLARVGRRYSGGEAEDITALYRIPVGGARLTRDAEARYFHGPPLPNPQLGAARGRHELFVTTFDRDRKVGVLYRMVDGHAELFAGGTPERGEPAVLRQPEGVAVDPRGGLYVADRDRGVVLRLDTGGRVVDPRYAAVPRPRVLAVDDSGALWIGADGDAEAPWQQGTGEIWRVGADGTARLVLRGPMPQAIGASPGGHIVVADRHAARLFALAPDGTRTELVRFTDGDVPRSLAFAPVTPATRRAGIAGDLFVITMNRGAWPLSQVVRISGPIDDLIRGGAPR